MTPGDAAPATVLVDAATLARRCGELADEVTRAHAGAAPPVLVGILKGSTLFFADLVRRLAIDVEVDFMSISSYSASARQSGIVRIVKDLDCDIRDRDVIVIEDIVDTGLTLNYLRRALRERGPRTLETIALLDKKVRRIVPVPVEYTGFEIPDVFVVGYGLDFQGRYRNVPDLLAVRDLARLANDPMLLVDSVF